MREMTAIGWSFLLSLVLSKGEEVAFSRVDPKITIACPEVAEASGLAVSSRDREFLWVVNDSGAKAILHLVGSDGADRGKVTVDGAENVDWEDLCSFKSKGVSYLLIADTGDNNSTRETSTLYIVEEPKLPGNGDALAGAAKPVWMIRFQFEDGPRDCESVAVDSAAGKVLLVSKRTKPPMVYELPLNPGKEGGVLIAKRIGVTSVQPPKGVPPLPYIAQPTGMDVTEDGSLGAIVSYYGVFLFERKGKEGWGDAFARPPLALTPHGMNQAESVAFGKDGKTISIVSERGDRRIIRYER
jgi:hypothetical protein